MSFFIKNLNYFGVTHKVASLELREHFALNDDQIIKAYELSKKFEIHELFILSTCARTEFYAFCNKNELLTFIRFLYKTLEKKCNFNFLIYKNAEECVRQIMLVSSSIDSMLIGETQITNQIKKSFQLSKDKRACGSILSRMIQSSLEVGKNIRNETKLSDGALSISYAAVQKIDSMIDDLKQETIFIVGAGVTGKLVAQNFKKRGADNILITNRDLDRGQKLASEVNGEFLPFEIFNKYIHKASILITCTNASYNIITYKEILEISKIKKKLILMDLSVPRNIESSISNIDNCNLLSIDDIQDVINELIKKRYNELPKANEKIEEKILDFTSWFNQLKVTPTIADLKHHYESIQKKEINKISNKYDENTLDAIDVFSNSLIKKIMKDSIEFLKSDKKSDLSKEQLVDILREVHGFDK